MGNKGTNYDTKVAETTTKAPETTTKSSETTTKVLGNNETGSR